MIVFTVYDNFWKRSPKMIGKRKDIVFSENDPPTRGYENDIKTLENDIKRIRVDGA